MKKYFTLIILLTILLTGCSNNTTAIKGTSSDVAKEGIAEVLDITSKSTKTNTTNSSGINKAVVEYVVPELSLSDIFTVRECDNEWAMPISYESICRYSELFSDYYLPIDLSITLTEFDNVAYITGFVDNEGYFAIPGEFFVGLEVTKEELFNTYGVFCTSTQDGDIITYTWEWVNEVGDENTLHISWDVNTHLITKISFDVKLVRNIMGDEQHTTPVKYMKFRSEEHS